MSKQATFKQRLFLVPALIAAILVLLFPAPTFATSGDDTDTVTLTVNVTDETGEYIEVVVVGFINKETNKHDVTPLTIERGNSYGTGAPLLYSLPKGKTYLLEFIFPIDRGMVVLSADGSLAPQEISTNSDITLNLKIAWRAAETAPSSTGSVAPSSAGIFDPTRIATTNAEGNAIFTEFINATKHMVENPDLSFMFDGQRIQLERDAENYEKYTGSPAQEFRDVGIYGQWILYETFLSLYSKAISGNNEYYFGSEENFVSRACTYTTLFGNAESALKIDMSAERAAYLKVMLWEYDYIKENGLPYNFITGVTDPAAAEGESQISGIDIQLPNERDTNLTDEEVFSDLKPKDTSFLGMLKGSISGIIIVIILAVAFLIFFFWRRKKNIDDKENV